MLFHMKDQKAAVLENDLNKLQKDGPAVWASLPEDELFTPAGFSEEQAEATAYSNYSYWGSTFRAFFKNRMAVALLIALVVVVAFAFVQPHLPGQVDPNLCEVDPATGIQYRNIAPGQQGFIWGSNAIGLFTDFRPFEDTRLIGVEPAGMGIASGKHGVTLGEGQLGIFFGARSYNMQTPEGQINESYSISAGLDFPSVGPEHAHLKYTGRAEYVSVTDREALGAFLELSLKEGIIPALESSHALAYALKMARAEPEKEQKLVVNLSGRGDKDIFQVAARLEADGCLKDGRLSSDALGAYAD